MAGTGFFASPEFRSGLRSTALVSVLYPVVVTGLDAMKGGVAFGWDAIWQRVQGETPVFSGVFFTVMMVQAVFKRRRARIQGDV